MKKEVLESRYEGVETIVIPTIENSAVITSNSQYYRTSLSLDKRNIEFIDFEGGPFIRVGDEIQGKKIKSIKACHLIEFE